jgi:hypothetical protein
MWVETERDVRLNAQPLDYLSKISSKTNNCGSAKHTSKGQSDAMCVDAQVTDMTRTAQLLHSSCSQLIYFAATSRYAKLICD